MFSHDYEGQLAVTRDGSPLMLKIERSSLPPELQSADNSTLAMQPKPGFPGQCLVFPYTVASQPMLTANVTKASVASALEDVSGENTTCEQHTESSNDNSKSWSDSATKLLIATYADIVQTKSKRLSKRKDLWASVAEVMNSKGYTVSANDCDEKYRRLKRTYKEKRDTRKQSGEAGGKKWKFYDDMDSCEGSNASVLTVAESVEKKRKVGANESAEKPSTLSEAQAADCDKKVPGKRRKDEPPQWFSTFLQQHQEEQKEWRSQMTQRLNAQEEAVRERNSVLREIRDKLLHES
jgi:hypothetical protein